MTSPSTPSICAAIFCGIIIAYISTTLIIWRMSTIINSAVLGIRVENKHVRSELMSDIERRELGFMRNLRHVESGIMSNIEFVESDLRNDIRFVEFKLTSDTHPASMAWKIQHTESMLNNNIERVRFGLDGDIQNVGREIQDVKSMVQHDIQEVRWNINNIESKLENNVPPVNSNFTSGIHHPQVVETMEGDTWECQTGSEQVEDLSGSVESEY